MSFKRHESTQDPAPPPPYTNNNFVDMDMVEAVYVK